MFKVKKKKEEENEEEDSKDQKLDSVSKELDSIEQDLQNLMGNDSVTEEEIQRELERLEHEVKTEKINEERIVQQGLSYRVKNKRITDDIREIIPLWIEKPIYWITPGEKFEKRKKKWIEEWGEFLISYTDTKHIFVVIIRDLRNEFPFKNPLVSKQLTREQLVLIGDYLENINRAIWLDQKKTRLLVLWQTREETSLDLYQWAQEEGRQFVSIFELLEDDYWHTLPEEEIRRIFSLLVRADKAIYVNNREKNSIRFEFKY